LPCPGLQPRDNKTKQQWALALYTYKNRNASKKYK